MDQTYQGTTEERMKERDRIDISKESIEYESDAEYTDAFCRFFRIEKREGKEEGEGEDKEEGGHEEEIDEYDEETISHGLHYIFDKTKDDPLFQSLYLKAAGTFLSEDVELGLPVLLSYSHFPRFYLFLKRFLQGCVVDVDEHDALMKMFDRN